jgi:hypothetical protein
MSWLEQTLVTGQRKVGEWAAAQTLTRFRREEEHFAWVYAPLLDRAKVWVARSQPG